MNLKTCFALLLFCVLISPQLVGQTNSTSKRINWKFLDASSDLDKSHSPRKAAIYSTLLPGLGQGYNKKYWKIPVIYGLGGFLGYKIIQNQKQYKTHRDELFKRDLQTAYPSLSFNVDPNSPFNDLSTELIRTRKDLYRDDRDRFILFSSLLYIVNIVDAVVDAHLVTFTVGENAKLSFEPTLIPNRTYASTGLQMRLNF